MQSLFKLFLTAIWLNLGQLWTTDKEVASLTRCYSQHYFKYDPKSTGSLVIRLVPKSDWAHQWDSNRKPSDSKCYVLAHCATLSESAQETINHRLAGFFSRNYRSFSFFLNIIHTLSQCHYYNFKHVNVGWEMLR